MSAPTNVVPLELVPVSLAEAKRFVGHHHRHNLPPLTWKFGVGVKSGGELVGVAMAGLPKARMLMDGYTLEVNRTCTTGEPNANSMLYGAIARAAKALGWRRLITYTLASEPGTSLLAAGWMKDAEVPAAETWARSCREIAYYDHDLFGNERRPQAAKVRWLRVLREAS